MLGKGSKSKEKGSTTFDTLPTALMNHTINPEGPRSFRRGRFEAAPASREEVSERSSHSDGAEEKQWEEERREEEDTAGQEREEIEMEESGRMDRRRPGGNLRRRVFSKTIEAIDRGLLGEVEDYMGRGLRRGVGEELPQAQIERTRVLR